MKTINGATLKLRIDDFPQGMPYKRFDAKNLEMLRYIDSKNIPYCLAVVPDLVCYQDKKILHSLKNATLGTHGFNHGIDHWRPASEFKQMTMEEILAALERARILLDSITCENPYIFIPPFNMFNQNLLDGLNKFGYKYITGGPETFSQMNKDILDFGNVQLCVSKGRFYTSNGDLNKILDSIKEVPEGEHVVVHLCDEYQF